MRSICWQDISRAGARNTRAMMGAGEDMDNKKVLVTGAAGFIGGALCEALLETTGCSIIGIDSITPYYDVRLKEERLARLKKYAPRFRFVHGSIADKSAVEEIFKAGDVHIVVNLAAQAGVRYSIENPDAYIESNIVGFFNILESCRHHKVEHLVFASSSSVYGTNKKVPYSTEDKVDNPVSLYAATKKSDELMAHAYSALYGIPCTGLRFFTVYGPMGRPDMAYFKFTERMVNGKSIELYNNGDMKRDFTYIDDIIKGVINVMPCPPAPNADGVKYKIYNIGNNSPETLLHFVDVLEECLIKEGVIKERGQRVMLPMQAGDVYQTYADVTDLQNDFGFKPSTPLEKGLSKFAKWYRGYKSSV